MRSVRALAAGLFALAAIAAAGPADSVVAVVGETAILQSELRQAMDFIRIASMDTMTPDEELRERVLDQLINNLLLQEQARNDTIEVTREEIQAGVEDNIRQMRDRFPDEEQYRAALAAEGLTERDLRRRYEDDVRRTLLSQRLMQQEGLVQTYVSPAECERFYDDNCDSIARVPGRVTLAHILIPVLPSDEAEQAAQVRAAEVIDILTQGGDFAVVAGSFSDDARTAGSGGDWGWNGLDDIPPDLAMVLSQLQPGQVSPPFRSFEGYILTRLDSRSGDRVRFRTILFRVPLRRADSTRALRTARSVRADALKGVPFDSLARRFSQDPVTADSGGFLGDFLIEGLSPPFDSVVAGLDSGDVSEPVLSEHGYHIINVISKQPERVMSYLEMQDMIRRHLNQQKSAEKLEKYLARIAERVYVKRYD